MKALITGANSLVNKVLLERLIKEGYEVTAHYHSDNDITKQLKTAHPDARFIQADFSTKDGMIGFIEEAFDTKYDVIVLGAVYYAEGASWKAQQDWDEWQKSFAINSTVNGVLMAHADISVNKGGVIIPISSVFGKPYVLETQFGIYRATKAALDSMICTYAKKWAPNIRVAGIGPGWVKSAWNKDMKQEDIDAMLASQNLAKLVEPEEIADLMVAIINIKTINATTITIDGGLGIAEQG